MSKNIAERDELDAKANRVFAGKVVRKDLVRSTRQHVATGRRDIFSERHHRDVLFLRHCPDALEDEG